MSRAPVLAGSHALPDLWNRDPIDVDPDQEAQDRDIKKLAIIAGVTIGLLFLLVALAPIRGAVTGAGTVGVQSRVKRIAHPFGGTIREILVVNGQKVKQGQLLLKLDDDVNNATADASSLTLEQLQAQRARLEAERTGATRLVFPTELTTSKAPGATAAMRDEQRLFDIRSSEQVKIEAQLDQQATQAEKEIDGLNAQIVAAQKQGVLIAEERDAMRELWKKQLVTITRLNALERTAADIDGRIASFRADIARATSKITEVRERAIQIGQTRRAEAGRDLSQVMTALNGERARNVAAIDQRTRTEVRAPYSGTVEKIAFAAVGDVIRAAEPIMEIVPDQDNFVVEASIRPADIDQLRSGQHARVRFTAFNLAVTPEIQGKVIYVAADRTEDPATRQPYFVARIEINPADLKAEDLDLRSGMPVEVHVETGSRTLLSYILKPLRDQFMRAFRDG
jgi:HlyD family type I secretion membrane fusion protein